MIFLYNPQINKFYNPEQDCYVPSAITFIGKTGKIVATSFDTAEEALVHSEKDENLICVQLTIKKIDVETTNS